MLEIVAKRAALRPSDPAGSSSNKFEVSVEDNLHAAEIDSTNITHTINNVVYSSLLLTVVSILVYFHFLP